MSNLEIELSLEELVEVGRTLHLCVPDERHKYSDVQLLCEGKERRWIAADRARAAEVRGGPDSRRYDIAVPPSLLRRAVPLAGHETSLVLSVDDSNAQRELTLSGAGGATTVLEGVVSWDSPERYFHPDVKVAASAVFRAHHLAGAIFDEPRVRRGKDDDESVSDPEVHIGVAESQFRVYINWAGLAPIVQTIPAEEQEGQIWVPVGLERLQQVLLCFEPEELLTIHLPQYNSDSVLLASDRRRAVLMPRPLASVVLRDEVEQLIEEVAGPAARQADADRNYSLHNIEATVYGRLIDDANPPALQVISVVLDGVEATPELLDEINQLNSNLQFVRLFHRDTQVRAVVDLFASSIDADELRGAINRILDVARRITPLLAALFGGAGADPVEARWVAARSVVVGAWLLPMQSVDLTGPEAIEGWPFPGPVWVVSGWNPQGVSYNLEQNRTVNRKIAADLSGSGERFVTGANRRDDGTVVAETLVIWGLDRETAVDLGNRASQDVIYEITEDAVSLVSCHSDRVESWPRR